MDSRGKYYRSVLVRGADDSVWKSVGSGTLELVDSAKVKSSFFYYANLQERIVGLLEVIEDEGTGKERFLLRGLCRYYRDVLTTRPQKHTIFPCCEKLCYPKA